MQMLLNNGTILSDAPSMPAQTRKYLNQFWSFPSSEKIKKEKEKYYVFDFKGRWTRKKEALSEIAQEILI